MATGALDWENIRLLSAASLTGSYQALGTPLANPGYIVKMINNSTADVLISNDGINDKDICPAGSYWLYDESKVGPNGSAPALPAGTQISVRGSAGTGNIYLVVQYLK